ncbi:hypothetical protein QUF96_01330 [Bacillus bombysepticus]|nr:hypothetical protein [Bacillus bombysepticus]
MEEKKEPKMVSMTCYGWNKEKRFVEFQLLINEEIFAVYKKDVRDMEQFFLVNEK